MKYLKVLFDTKSRYSDFEYKMDEINIAELITLTTSESSGTITSHIIFPL